MGQQAWPTRNAVIATVAVVVFSSVLLMSAFWLGTTEKYQAIYQQKYAVADAAAAKEYIEQKCRALGLSPKEVAKCHVSEVAAARQEQRAEQDLHIQREMADWAEGTLAISAFGLLAAIIGTIGVFWTLRETRAALVHAKDTSKRELRAYITIEDCTHDPIETDALCRTNVVITNIGNTGALNVQMCCQTYVRSREVKPRAAALIIAQLTLGKAAPLAKGSVITLAQPTIVRISAADWVAIGRGDKALHTYGKITYDDVFGDRHVTTFWRSTYGPDAFASDAMFINAYGEHMD